MVVQKTILAPKEILQQNFNPTATTGYGALQIKHTAYVLLGFIVVWYLMILHALFRGYSDTDCHSANEAIMGNRGR